MAIHISEADAAREFISLLAKVRAGEEVIIEDASAPVAVMRKPTGNSGPRLLSDSLGRAARDAEKLGYGPVMGDDFAQDMQDILRLRYERPRRSPTEWE